MLEGLPCVIPFAIYIVPFMFNEYVPGLVVPIPTFPDIYVILFLGTIATLPTGFIITLSIPDDVLLSFSQPIIKAAVSVFVELK